MIRSGISQDLQKIDSLKFVLSAQPASASKVEQMLEFYNTLTESREYEQAKQYLDSVYTLSTKLNYQAGLAKYYSTQGKLLQKQWNYTEALKYDSLSLIKWSNLGDSLQVADACVSMGEDYAWLQNLTSSKLFLDRAMRIYKEKGERPGQVNVYNKYGLIYRFRGDYPEAINQYETAIKLAEEIGDIALINKNKLSLGIIYKYQENWPKALEIFLQTVPYYEQTANLEILVPLDNCVGNLFFYQKDYSEALSHLNSALDGCRTLGMEMDAAANLTGIGQVYRELGQYNEALRYEFQALQIISAQGNRKEIGWANLEVGYTYSASGHMQEANEYFSLALEISGEVQDIELKSASLLAIGKTMIGLAENNNSGQSAELYESAKNYLNQSLDLLLGIGNKQHLTDNYMLLFKADSATGNLSSALYNYKKFTFYKDNINNVANEKEIARLQYEFLRQQKEKEITDLTLENEIKSLQVKNHRAALLASSLEAENQKAQILLLNNSEELNKLQLEKTKKDLETKNSAILLKEAELASAKKIKEFQDREIRKQKMQRNGILFTSGLLLLTGILIIRSIQLRRKLDKQQAISLERERISGDLHDDIGSGLSKIILMLEVLHKEARLDEIKDRTRAISKESLELSKNMSSVIWALNSRYDSLESLVAFIRKYASDYFENSQIGFKMNAPAHFPQVHLSSEQRRNIYYAVKEALHNIVKHANATSAEIGVTCANQVLSLKVKDNGCGLPANKNDFNGFGNGIIQMRKRMENSGGKFYMENGVGTTLTFVLPVEVK
jgi:signal transduction histidine kinase